VSRRARQRHARRWRCLVAVSTCFGSSRCSALGFAPSRSGPIPPAVAQRLQSGSQPDSAERKNSAGPYRRTPRDSRSMINECPPVAPRHRKFNLMQPLPAPGVTSRSISAAHLPVISQFRTRLNLMSES
jgi:hypothetical protein